MNNKEFRTLLRSLTFPGGKNVSWFTDGELVHSAVWSKRSGHAGADVLTRLALAAKNDGFVQGSATSSSDATGDRVGRGTTLVKGDVTITIEAFLEKAARDGDTSYSNRFIVRVVCKPAKIVVD